MKVKNYVLLAVALFATAVPQVSMCEFSWNNIDWKQIATAMGVIGVAYMVYQYVWAKPKIKPKHKTSLASLDNVVSDDIRLIKKDNIKGYYKVTCICQPQLAVEAIADDENTIFYNENQADKIVSIKIKTVKEKIEEKSFWYNIPDEKGVFSSCPTVADLKKEVVKHISVPDNVVGTWCITLGDKVLQDNACLQCIVNCNEYRQILKYNNNGYGLKLELLSR